VTRLEVPAVDLKAQCESIRAEVEAALGRVFAARNFILGAEVGALEQEMARLHGCAHGVACGSGSDALLLSLMVAGVGPGDAVLVPAFTFFATASSVARLGARPLFVDIDPRTLNISSTSAQQTLQEDASAAAKALIPVHLYGQCADMDPLMALAEANGLAVIEDCAQAVLARYCGRPAGSIGKTGCFSFYPTKNLGGAGDGGMITSNDAGLAERLRLLRNHGSPDKRVFQLLGLNSRLDTLQAAILLVKLKHLESWTHLRQQKANFYRQAFASTNLVAPGEIYPSPEAPIVLPYLMPASHHVCHQFTVRVHDRDNLSAHLESNGVGGAIYYPVPLHRQPAFSAWNATEPCPEADRAAAEVLSLPLYPELTESQQSYVVDQVVRFYKKFA
jgi:dTDP-4-amino-4,6-dideoxygalactose transaminase